MVQTYNEFKVTYSKYGKIRSKNQTERATVRISEFTANVNNTLSDFPVLIYELVPEKEKSDKRIALEAEANRLGVTFRDNIGDVKLLNKINEAKK